ncbi:unnamed protein product [marine sediment metagenome]|uniref:Uncharacterized protein n=1 Tax=marine sediment metagenome TaxID=412755 RepID=X1SCB7_9ZZZZ
MVVFTQAQTTLYFMPGMIISPGDKVVGLKIKWIAAVGASACPSNHPAP